MDGAVDITSVLVANEVMGGSVLPAKRNVAMAVK